MVGAIRMLRDTPGGGIVPWHLKYKLKCNIYPLCPNMPGNVDNYFLKIEDLKAHFIVRISIHNSCFPTLFRDI